jgi:hypothetical protein
MIIEDEPFIAHLPKYNHGYPYKGMCYFTKGRRICPKSYIQ